MKLAVDDGRLAIVQEGKVQKFVERVEPVTFSGRYACQIAPDVLDAYTEVVKNLVGRYHSGVTRYTTSTFLRMKLGDALQKRDVAPHIYESRAEAQRALTKQEVESNEKKRRQTKGVPSAKPRTGGHMIRRGEFSGPPIAHKAAGC